MVENTDHKKFMLEAIKEAYYSDEEFRLREGLEFVSGRGLMKDWRISCEKSLEV